MIATEGRRDRHQNEGKTKSQKKRGTYSNGQGAATLLFIAAVRADRRYRVHSGGHLTATKVKKKKNILKWKDQL